MTNFDPNGVGQSNGQLFGFPVEEHEADLIIIPVPWDATASYGKGTAGGPEAIREASLQLDFYHPALSNAHETKVLMLPPQEKWLARNEQWSPQSLPYIEFLENGGVLSDHPHFSNWIQQINQAQQEQKKEIRTLVDHFHQQGKMVAVLGGEHSTPLALIEALNDRYADFGILQIDAHADLRIAYENFEESHASIMYNALKNCEHLSKLVQVGIRDIAPSEVKMIEDSGGRITTFYDWQLQEDKFEGATWKSLCHKIIDELPENVYISFDIDGLIPSLCPHTGTPVPGGLLLEEVNYLFFQLLSKGKNIIGFDLNEVGVSKHSDWDANVGARALWNLVVLMEKQKRANKG